MIRKEFSDDERQGSVRLWDDFTESGREQELLDQVSWLILEAWYRAEEKDPVTPEKKQRNLPE